MTRQIALAAIIAFALTVLVISIWEPKAEPTPVPPAPAAATAPVEGAAPQGVAFKAGLSLKRGERFGAAIRSPTIERRIETRAIELFGTDAGTP